jgi:antirestriction protein ArdC
MDLYQSITDKIIRQMESNPGEWKMPWTKTGGDSMPRSADGRAYRGINIVTLWAASIDKGYSSPVWATYKQWNKHGCQVRRGEKAEMVVFYKRIDQFNVDSGEVENRLMARAFFVFNSAQVDGYNPRTGDWKSLFDEVSVETRIACAEDYFRNIGADLRIVSGNRCFYSPSQDFIGIVPFDQFHSNTDYYSTVAHEHVHWTGHTTRLNRELQSSRFGDEAYAFEELVAELGSAFVCSQLGIENEPRVDHAQYLASWLKTLKNDKKAIFTASSKAQAALDYLEAFQPETSFADDEDEAIITEE